MPTKVDRRTRIVRRAACKVPGLFSLSLIVLAPWLMAAKGCEVADIGSDQRTCGGLSGSSCVDGEFCNYPLDALCGAADATGTCEAIPEACTLEYDPVCGCDDQTYGNSCAAHAAGVSVASEGECAEAPGPKSCGGLTGARCADGEFCNYPLGALCGAADATGTCEAMPEACTREYDPVCGCDDQTYGNSCAAHAAGVSVASEGECAEAPATCGGLTGDACGADEFCNYPLGALCGAADATGTCEAIPEACTQEYDPVCGCDDQTYGNACAAHAAGVSVAAEGECGESPTSCGGLGGVACGKGEFCNFAPEALCGVLDANGVCEPIPEGCTLEYNPVCGCDDQTYGNSCAAHAAGVSVAAQGECGEAAQTCGGLTGAGCGADEFCNYPLDALCGAADATGSCEAIPDACDAVYDPVCGCDDKTYSNACSAASNGVSVASQGECE